MWLFSKPPLVTVVPQQWATANIAQTFVHDLVVDNSSTVANSLTATTALMGCQGRMISTRGGHEHPLSEHGCPSWSGKSLALGHPFLQPEACTASLRGLPVSELLIWPSTSYRETGAWL